MVYPYFKDSYNYEEALGIKHPKRDSVATKNNTKQTSINMVFDENQDVHGFVYDVFKDRGNENAYKVKPNFLNPRLKNNLFKDHSANCVLM